jgi:hypothetical protein
VTVTISSLAESFSRIRVNGYWDGRPDGAASKMLALDESTELESVVLAAVEL